MPLFFLLTHSILTGVTPRCTIKGAVRVSTTTFAKKFPELLVALEKSQEELVVLDTLSLPKAKGDATEIMEANYELGIESTRPAPSSSTISILFSIPKENPFPPPRKLYSSEEEINTREDL